MNLSKVFNMIYALNMLLYTQHIGCIHICMFAQLHSDATFYAFYIGLASTMLTYKEILILNLV